MMCLINGEQVCNKCICLGYYAADIPNKQIGIEGKRGESFRLDSRIISQVSLSGCLLKLSLGLCWEPAAVSQIESDMCQGDMQAVNGNRCECNVLFADMEGRIQQLQL